MPAPLWFGYLGLVRFQRPTNRSLLRAVPSPVASAPSGRSTVDVGSATPSHTLSDDMLIEAVVAGDSRVAGQLYDRLVGIVDRTLYRVFGRRESDHDDLVQATFEQIVLTLTKRRYARA